MSQDLYVENVELLNTTPWDGTPSGPEPGDYEVVVADIERKPSSKQNIPQLIVKMEVVANADGSDTPMRGRNVWNRYNETGKGIGRLLAFLQACGVEINERGGYNAGEAIGAHLVITCTKRDIVTENDLGEKTSKTVTDVFKERPVETASADAGEDVAEEAEVEEEAAPEPPPPPARTASRAPAKPATPPLATRKPAAKPAARPTANKTAKRR